VEIKGQGIAGIFTSSSFTGLLGTDTIQAHVSAGKNFIFYCFYLSTFPGLAPSAATLSFGNTWLHSH